MVISSGLGSITNKNSGQYWAHKTVNGGESN